VRGFKDYLALPYTIEIIPDNGAWFARIKELPGCMTEVDEWEEILPAIEEAKYLWIELALERGRPIPEPQGLPTPRWSDAWHLIKLTLRWWTKRIHATMSIWKSTHQGDVSESCRGCEGGTGADVEWTRESRKRTERG
jgi:antitoxin HicB